MKLINKYLSILITFLIIGCKETKTAKNNTINESATETISYSTKIDSLIKATNPRAFNGVILITQKGNTKYIKAHGYSNFETKKPISLEDNFRIQSNSKQITSVLILKEVEKGKINLRSPIKNYLPNLEQDWTGTVTVHHLLNMSSGISDVNKPLLFEPGTDFYYSNPGYGLLGKIIENVTLKSYNRVANDLFKELGMNNTYCYEPDKVNDRLISGYRNSGDNFNKLEFDKIGFTEKSWNNFLPAGGIISNIKDLNTWDSKLHNGKILNSKSYDLMTNYTITSKHAAFGDVEMGYGYGVRIDDSKPVKIIGHAGRGIGFACIKFYIPEQNIDVIVLENVYNENEDIIYHFETKIREIVLNSSLIK